MGERCKRPGEGRERLFPSSGKKGRGSLSVGGLAQKGRHKEEKDSFSRRGKIGGDRAWGKVSKEPSLGGEKKRFAPLLCHGKKAIYPGRKRKEQSRQKGGAPVLL